MASHQLSLEIPDTSNENILKIFDQSVYTALIAVTCPQLLITLPGFQYSVVVPEARLTEGFSLTLTACDLEIQTSNCDSKMNPIPDGIYAIKYQVSPHEYVFVEYNHLRLTIIRNRIAELRCNLDLGDCLPTREKEEQMNKLAYIWELFTAAKDKVEYCHEPVKGMKIYEYAMKHLDKMNCKTC